MPKSFPLKKAIFKLFNIHISSVMLNLVLKLCLPNFQSTPPSFQTPHLSYQAPPTIYQTPPQQYESSPTYIALSLNCINIQPNYQCPPPSYI